MKLCLETPVHSFSHSVELKGENPGFRFGVDKSKEPVFTLMVALSLGKSTTAPRVVKTSHFIY